MSKYTFDLPTLDGKDVWVLVSCTKCNAHEWWRARWLKTPPHAHDPGPCWHCSSGQWRVRPVLPLNDRAEVPS